MYKKINELMLEREKYLDIVNIGIRNNLYNDSFYNALEMTRHCNNKINVLKRLASV